MRSPQRLFWLGIASAALLPPLVLTNLYVVHDYYLAALTPAFAALVGLGADYVWRALPRRPGVTVAAIVAGLALVCAPFAWSVSYWGSGYANVGDAEQLALAREIDAVTSPDDYVAIVGYDWSPSVLYYAHRRGHMVVTPNESFAYDLIHDQGYRFLLAAPRAADDLGFLWRWQWLGALGPHTFALADSPTTLPSSSFISTYDRTWVDERAGSAKRLESAFRLPCGHRRQIPAGVRGTWLRIADADPNTRLSALDSLVSLPVRRAVYVGPALARAGHISIACSGTRSVRVLEVVDRGPPS